MEDNDAQLQLKKRARRRLVGAAFFVSVVAVVLPMVMDHEPRQVVQDVEGVPVVQGHVVVGVVRDHLRAFRVVQVWAVMRL